MEDDDFTFDFEQALPDGGQATQQQQQQQVAQQSQQGKPRNYRQTVCTYWLRGLCMKGDTCGFLHEFDPEKMPVCRNLLKYGTCKEPDCPYKHSTEEIKECNMYKLGFCIYGPACRFKHTRLPGPPPDPERLEAAKPKEFRNINIVANQANEGILPADVGKQRLTLGAESGEDVGQLQLIAGGGNSGVPSVPSFVDPSLLASVGQKDLRYGF
eukprot:jgi/Picsp_1/3023/NSC_01245-R1_c-x8-c-x5-c-x3-h type zn-finger